MVTRRISDDRHQRSVLNFTFRDSIREFVNVSYWLPPKDLIIISSKFSTGDVGESVSNGIVKKSLSPSSGHTLSSGESEIR